MTEIMPVPRNLILLSYQQGAFRLWFFSTLEEGEKGRFEFRSVMCYKTSANNRQALRYIALFCKF